MERSLLRRSEAEVACNTMQATGWASGSAWKPDQTRNASDVGLGITWVIWRGVSPMLNLEREFSGQVLGTAHNSPLYSLDQSPQCLCLPKSMSTPILYHQAGVKLSSKMVSRKQMACQAFRSVYRGPPTLSQPSNTTVAMGRRNPPAIDEGAQHSEVLSEHHVAGSASSTGRR